MKGWFSRSDLILSSLVFYIYQAKMCQKVNKEKTLNLQPLDSLTGLKPESIPVCAS